MCMTLTLTFLSKVKCKYANRKPTHDGNSNFYRICHIGYHFKDINCPNMRDLDLNLLNFQGQIYIYATRKPLSEFRISHTLRDNHIITFEILLNSVFDLEIELKYMSDNFAYYKLDDKLIRLQFGKEMAVLSQTVSL